MDARSIDQPSSSLAWFAEHMTVWVVVITAIGYLVGWRYLTGYYRVLNIPSSALGFTPIDYLFGTGFPLFFISFALFAGFPMRWWFLVFSASWTRASPTMKKFRAGLYLLIIFIVMAARLRFPPTSGPESSFSLIFLAFAILPLLYEAILVGLPRIANWFGSATGLIFLIALIALSCWVAPYWIGRGNAELDLSELRSGSTDSIWKSVVLVYTTPMGLPGETAQPPYYSTSGLRLIIKSPEKYFLIGREGLGVYSVADKDIVLVKYGP
ncbi:MAG: hypothetical protein JW395_1754 [Nitrospira sp.]|nr:hypothetical protein [Nitrospira sp.]